MITVEKKVPESAKHNAIRSHVGTGEHEKQKRVNANIPESLFRSFKKKLAENDESMRDVLITFIEKYSKE